jgi:hypothetical protein
MINWREYTIYLEQIFDVINVFYTRVNYIFFTFKILVIFWFNNRLVSRTFTFNSERLQYFLPRLIIVDFFLSKNKIYIKLVIFFQPVR